MQARTGKTNEWEDPICTALGYDWRHRRDDGTTAKDWKHVTNKATIDLLTGWNMSMGKPVEQKVDRTTQRRKTDHFLEPHPPPVELEAEDWTWEAKGFKMVVDCQPLASVLNGETSWTDDTNQDIGKEVVNQIYTWTSRHGLDNLRAQPVVWRQREKNKVADYLARKAMHTKTSWCNIDSNAAALIAQAAGIIFFSDGGFRPGKNEASAAWLVVSVVTRPTRQCFVIAEGAIFDAQLRNSFCAELMAIHSLIVNMDPILRSL